MAQNQNIGLFGQYLTVNTTANSILLATTAAFYNNNGQANASAGAFVGNAYATLGGSGGNYLAFGQQTTSAQWIQSGYSSAGAPVYYSIILNPLGGNIGIGNTIPSDRLSVNGTTYLQGNVRFTQGISDSTGTQGTAGQVLTSNGSGNVYWSTVSYTFSTGLTNTANTITVNSAYIATISANNASYLGGTIASSYLANTSYGLSQNTSGHFVVAGTGAVVNATGVHVNSTYIGTISANNASYLGGAAAASYALLASPTFTGTTTGNALNVTTQTNTATLYVTTSANVGTYFTVNSTSAVKAVNASFTGANLSIGGTNTYITSNTLITGTLTSAANVILNNNINIIYKTISGANVSFVQQNDDNFVFYSTNTAGGQRAVYSIFANSITSNFNFAVRTAFNGGVIIPTGQTLLDSTGSQGTVGQVLTSNGTGNVYWSTVSSGASYTFSTGLTNTANTITVNSAYIATISANNASYLGTVAAASYQGTANLAAAVALLPANNASYLGGTAAASYALLAGPTFTGTVTTANTLTIGTVAYHVANGNLGLGTSSPAATLDVVGTVNTSKANTLSQTLTDGVTVSWDTSLGQVATVTLAGNRTMAAPTNLKVQTYILHVLQDATGSRTLTWNAIFKWPAGVAPTLTTTANARDIFSFVSDGTNLYGSLLPNVK